MISLDDLWSARERVAPVIRATPILTSTSLSELAGRCVGHDLTAVGIDLDLGPVADVNSNPANPVIGTRSFGAEPDRVSRHVAAWVTGLQSTGAVACVKHFPGHGDTAQDSHLTLPVVEAAADVVRSRDLAPFAAAIAAGAGAVMTSHLMVPSLDPEQPATLSGRILGLLRSDLGFDGVIVSDALDMAGASAGRGIPERTLLDFGVTASSEFCPVCNGEVGNVLFPYYVGRLRAVDIGSSGVVGDPEWLRGRSRALARKDGVPTHLVEIGFDHCVSIFSELFQPRPAERAVQRFRFGMGTDPQNS